MARLLNADASASVDSAAVNVPARERDAYRIVQVVISAAATVKIQGRAATDLPWVDVKEYTADGADAVAMFPEMRASVTGNTGTVTVELDNK